MSTIAGLTDFRGQGPPGDIGQFLFPCTAIVFRFTFSGTTYYAAMRVGVSGWVLISQGAVPETVINAAFTTLGAGARVILLRGTYTLQAAGIAFTAVNQVLEGQGRITFIDGDALATTVHAINLSGFDDCTIRNLSVQTQDGGGKVCHCVFIEDGADRFHVENMVVVDSDDDGIHIEGTNINEGWILNCKILDVDGEGIYGYPDAGNSFNYIHIEGCTVRGAGLAGIYLAGAGTRTWNHCIIANNIAEGNQYFGIGTWYNYDSTVEGNVCYNNGLALGFDEPGIYIGSSERITVTGNDCHANFNYGIEVEVGTRISIVGNICYSNLYHGIELDDVLHSTVTGNVCSLNDSDDTAVYNGINLESNCNECSVTGNICERNHNYGMSVGCKCSITGNVCARNDRHGIYVSADGVVIEGNHCYWNGQDAAGTYHGIYIDYVNNLINSNYCWGSGGDQEDGIYLANFMSNNLICGNYCTDGMGSGISLISNNDECFIIGNYCNYNDDYGIEIGAANCDDNWVINNWLLGNGTGPFLDNGTDTKMHTAKFQFQHGGTEAGGIVVGQFVHATASAKGWAISGATEWAIALGHLPLEIQQVVRINVWAVGLAAPGAGNQMRLDINVNAGQDDQAYTAEPIAVANKNNVTENFAVNDIIHWMIDATDDTDIGDLIGGDNFEVKVIYRVAGDSDIATDAVFRCVEFEYV